MVGNAQRPPSHLPTNVSYAAAAIRLAHDSPLAANKQVGGTEYRYLTRSWISSSRPAPELRWVRARECDSGVPSDEPIYSQIPT